MDASWHADKQIGSSGHSMGGKTVMALRRSVNPGIGLNKLIVADIATKDIHALITDPFLTPCLADVNPAFASATSRDIGARRSLTPGPRTTTRCLVPFLMKGLHRRKEGGFAWRFNVPVLQHALQDIVGHIELGLNTLPALFVRGSESDYVSEDDLDFLEEHFLHMDHHTIQGAGHWLHAQSPDEFFEVTADFLG